MTNYLVRRATLADAERLVHQRIRMFEDMGSLSGPGVDPAALAADFRAWLAETMAAETYVAWVYTEPEHRGRGVARLVMETIHAYCRAHGIGSLALNASSSGQPLYESMGYRVSHSPMMFLLLD